MRRTLIAAGTLLLGTSVVALADPPTNSALDAGIVPMAELDKLATLEAKSTLIAKHDEEKKALYLASLAKPGTAMGGPLEEAETVGGNTTAEALTPRPATQDYPPCSPGPGDDSCIQLYEPGVRAQLASWDRPTGGLGSGEPVVAMGGPDEPVVDKPVTAGAESTAEPVADKPVTSTDTAGDDSVVDSGKPDATPAVGGPVESRSGYPPCSSTVTDSCIQLYEPGVTGKGN
ncbi:MAG: hypothetical protein ACT4OE_11155 [Sphingosinicella sp.]